MQPDRDEVQELCALLRSRFPNHPDRVARGASHSRVARQGGKSRESGLDDVEYHVGIRRHGRDEAIHQTNDLLDMLKHIDKTAQNGSMCCAIAHPGFKDPISMRLIREIALSHSKSARTLVFINPRLDELPSEVLRLRRTSIRCCPTAMQFAFWFRRKRSGTRSKPVNGLAETSTRLKC